MAGRPYIWNDIQQGNFEERPLSRKEIWRETLQRRGLWRRSLLYKNSWQI